MLMGETVDKNSNKATPVHDSKWRLKIGDQIHGPYTFKQMRSLVMQGLLSPHSMIALANSQDWKIATQDSDIASIFHGHSNKKFGSRVRATPLAEERAPSKGNNFILVFDIKSESNTDLEQTIMRLGRASRLTNNIWILHGDYTAGTLRNTLIHYLGKNDTLFVVDTTRSKAAWFNLGPEMDSKIRKVWKDKDEDPAP